MRTFHIQGRIVKREGTRIVRDEVRLADTDDRGEAFRTAHDLVRDGFTVWVWMNVTRGNGRSGLDLVERLQPEPQPRQTPSPKGSTRVRAGRRTA